MTATTIHRPRNEPRTLTLPPDTWQPIATWLNRNDRSAGPTRTGIIAPTQLQAFTEQAGQEGRPGHHLAITMPQDSWDRLAAQLTFWTTTPAVIQTRNPSGKAPQGALKALAEAIQRAGNRPDPCG